MRCLHQSPIIERFLTTFSGLLYTADKMGDVEKSTIPTLDDNQILNLLSFESPIIETFSHDFLVGLQ